MTLTPSELLAMMNAAIHETGRRQIMMTCVATMFDPRQRTLTVANAGHHFPLHVRAGQVKSLVAQGQPLGASAAFVCESVVVPFGLHDVLVWFTDGVRGSPRGRLHAARLRPLARARRGRSCRQRGGARPALGIRSPRRRRRVRSRVAPRAPLRPAAPPRVRRRRPRSRRGMGEPPLPRSRRHRVDVGRDGSAPRGGPFGAGDREHSWTRARPRRG